MRTALLCAAIAMGSLSAACGGSTNTDSGLGGAAGAAGGTGGGVGGTLGGQCTEATQCKLFSDCCTCAAIGVGDPDPPSCFAECVQDACSALGVTAANVGCAAGSCNAGIDCSGNAACDIMQPICDPGMVASISKTCYGPCVPVTQCASVPSCAVCNGPLDTCVTIDAQSGPSEHCVGIPKGCEGTPTCECMGGSVCISPFDACSDLSGVDGMGCSCPAC